MSYNGCVKWFKGSYGFIMTDEDIPELGKNEVFVYFSGISGDGFKKLKRGQLVTFDVISGANGFQAVNVVVTGESPDTDSKEIKRLIRK